MARSRTVTAEQRQVCDKYGVAPLACEPGTKVGIAANVKTGVLPINGLRHRPEGGTNGWYIWAGEEAPGEDEDFFLPLHAEHVAAWCPQIVRFLALPPGSRFLVAGEYEDVWSDGSLLIV